MNKKLKIFALKALMFTTAITTTAVNTINDKPNTHKSDTNFNINMADLSNPSFLEQGALEMPMQPIANQRRHRFNVRPTDNTEWVLGESKGLDTKVYDEDRANKLIAKTKQDKKNKAIRKQRKYQNRHFTRLQPKV